jgi:hypothetical protein
MGLVAVLIRSALSNANRYARALTSNLAAQAATIRKQAGKRLNAATAEPSVSFSALKDIQLSVNTSVAGLQFDLTTGGTPISTLGTGFTFDSVSLGNGVIRVFVFALTNTTFTGNFCYVRGGAVSDVANVIGSDINGSQVYCTVSAA